MKRFLYHLLLFAVAFTSGSFRYADSKKTLTVSIKNIKDLKSPIVIGVFNAAANFPDKVVYKKYVATPHTDYSAIVHINDLDYGVYAISMFQDKNNDRKLNTNFLGIPTEPYAFSNNFRPKFTAPDFSECQFRYYDGNHSLVIALID